VVRWPVTGEVETRVLTTLATAGTTTPTELTELVGESRSTVHATLVRFVQAGLAHAEDGRVSLTDEGRRVADRLDGAEDEPGGSPHGAGSTAVPVVTIDLAEVGRAIGALWPSPPEPVADPDRSRGELLAADADRDAAVHVLADALAVGRLTSAEFDERTDRALAARTYGQLDEVLRGLGGLPRTAARSHPVRKVAFWVVAVISSPFVFLGSTLTAFGDTGDEIGIGLVLLVLTLPGLFGLWRWAWPRP
jgi:hypothetical protein